MNRDWAEAYRHAFDRDEETRAVLTDILNELDHYNMVAADHDTTVRQNVAKKILGKLGVYQPHNVHRITQAYLAIDWEGPDVSKNGN